MCGIAGFLSAPGERADRAIVERMIAALSHRGPDAVGYHVDGRVALGIARLRIIDLQTGDQPIANEDQSVHVVLNGEIYNYRTLREELFLARDRMGEKPLYYTFADGTLVFASELRALLAHPAVGRRLDLRGLARYLA